MEVIGILYNNCMNCALDVDRLINSYRLINCLDFATVLYLKLLLLF